MPNIDTASSAMAVTGVRKVFGQSAAGEAGYIPVLGTINYTVGSTGCDFTTLTAAFAHVSACLVHNPGVVSITLEDGLYEHTAPLYATNPNFFNVFVKGKNIYGKTVSSVQSSSGSAGAWSIVINLNNVTNIAVGDYVAITAPSGGTLPTFLAGCHAVTDVDAINNRITISSKHRHASAPSGAVSATLKVLKTILKFTDCDGVVVYNNTTLGSVENLAIVGNGTNNGISVQDSSRLYIGGTVGVANFDYNVFSIYAAEINGGIIVSSGAANHGFKAEDGGIISLSSGCVSSGCGQVGMYSVTHGQITAPAAISTGNAAQGLYASYFGCVSGAGLYSTGNNRGVETKNRGYIDPAQVTLADNTQTDTRSETFAHMHLAPTTGTQVTLNFADGAGNTSYLTQNGAYLQAVNNNGIIEVNGKTGVKAKLNGNTKVEVNATGLGFHGVSPIARPVLPTGAGKTVDEVITVLQNYGLVSQS